MGQQVVRGAYVPVKRSPGRPDPSPRPYTIPGFGPSTGHFGCHPTSGRTNAFDGIPMREQRSGEESHRIRLTGGIVKFLRDIGDGIRRCFQFVVADAYGHPAQLGHIDVQQAVRSGSPSQGSAERTTWQSSATVDCYCPQPTSARQPTKPSRAVRTGFLTIDRRLRARHRGRSRVGRVGVLPLVHFGLSTDGRLSTGMKDGD